MTYVTSPPRDGLLDCWRSTRSSDLASHIRILGDLDHLFRSTDDWPSRLIGEIEASGLTGRGGGGFAAWRKMVKARSLRGEVELVVNAMEGEPASDKDHVLLLCAPHLVLDGARLVAQVIGATSVVVCVPDDRPDSYAAIRHAISERETRSFDPVRFQITKPPARFLTGEESALANWLGQGIAVPTFRVDKSVQLRVRNRPVLIHNAETVAHVGMIARRGSRWFRERGTVSSPGTTLVTLSGSVSKPGVYEVALGTPINEIVLGAEPVDGVSGVILGGYGGSVMGPDQLEVGFCNEELSSIGATTGAGVVCVIGRQSCGVAETARVARYLARQSSGQCGPCKFGLPAIATSLEQFWRGGTDRSEWDTLRYRLAQIHGRGGCRHPDGAVRFVASAMNVFRDDFASHAMGTPCRFANSPSVLAFRRTDSE